MPKGEKHRKYTQEEKREVLENHEKKHLSVRELSDKYQISTPTLKDWINAYESNGMRSSASRQHPQKSYTPEYRRSVLKELFLSPIMDLYNGEIVSYNIARRAKYVQVETMLAEAFNKIPDGTNLVLHSEQGWQYQMKAYQRSLREKGIRQSMSRRGNCYDNAAMENFFGHLKSELLYLRKFTDVEQLEREIREYIEYYNNKRIREKLDGMSPVQYRIFHENAA